MLWLTWGAFSTVSRDIYPESSRVLSGKIPDFRLSTRKNQQQTDNCSLAHVHSLAVAEILSAGSCTQFHSAIGEMDACPSWLVKSNEES